MNEGRKEGRKYFEFLLFPFSIISIVLHRGGTELMGDKSIDVSSKSEN